MDSETLPRSFARLKVFPLPPVVLFPGTGVPLHIFEPRYRQLVTHALETDGLMALAQEAVGEKACGLKAPLLSPIACVGRIAWHEKLEDGRLNLVLEGLARVRLGQEVQSANFYREFEAEVVPEEDVTSVEEMGVRQALLNGLGKLQRVKLPTWVWGLSGGRLADAVAAMVVEDVAQRRELLVELSAAPRLQLLLDMVARRIAQSPKDRDSTFWH